MKTFIGGIGCFWDETKYENIDGIISTECGYCGGDDPNITYKAVCGGDTGHIEVVKVQYDEKIKSYEEMVRYRLSMTATKTIAPSSSSFISSMIVFTASSGPNVNAI